MKLYIASSWKNEGLLIELAERIRSWGHEVDCFCDGRSGRYVFSFTELPGHERMTEPEFLAHPKTQRAFAEDRGWLEWAEGCVLVLPAGRSAHLEAGYAKGCGKPVFILGEFPVGEIDVMYGFATALLRWDQLNELKAMLDDRDYS